MFFHSRSLSMVSSLAGNYYFDVSPRFYSGFVDRVAFQLSKGLSFNDAIGSSNREMPDAEILLWITESFFDEDHSNASIVLRAAIEAGADINAYLESWQQHTHHMSKLWPFYTISVLNEVSDILFNDGKNSATPNNFLYLVSKAFGLNAGYLPEKLAFVTTLIDKGVDINERHESLEGSFFEELLGIGEYELMHTLVVRYPNQQFTISPEGYAGLFFGEGPSDTKSQLQKMQDFIAFFPELIDVNGIYSLARYRGASDVEIDAYLDVYHLARDMATQTSLSSNLALGGDASLHSTVVEENADL